VALLALLVIVYFLAKWRTQTEVDALMICGQEKYLTDVGTINFRQYSLGDVLAYDATNNVQRLTGLSIIPNEIEETGIVHDGSVKFRDALAFEFSSPLPSSTEAKIRSRVAGNLVLHITDYKRRSIPIPVLLAKLRTPDFIHFLGQDIHRLLSGLGNREKFYVVSSVVFADSLKVEFSRTREEEGTLSFARLNVDGLHVNVYGQCLSNVEMSGGAIPAAYSLAPFLYFGDGHILFNQNDPYY
jgi:hypothetical protein